MFKRIGPIPQTTGPMSMRPMRIRRQSAYAPPAFGGFSKPTGREYVACARTPFSGHHARVTRSEAVHMRSTSKRFSSKYALSSEPACPERFEVWLGPGRPRAHPAYCHIMLPSPPGLRSNMTAFAANMGRFSSDLASKLIAWSHANRTG